MQLFFCKAYFYFDLQEMYKKHTQSNQKILIFQLDFYNLKKYTVFYFWVLTKMIFR